MEEDCSHLLDFEQNLTKCLDTISSKNETSFSPSSFEIVSGLLYFIIATAAIIGNSLLIIAIFSNRRLQTVTNYILVNLAISDLLMAIFCIPFVYIPLILHHWPFGKVLCYLLSPAQAVTVFISSYTLILLSLERYFTIRNPLRPVSKYKVFLFIALVWIAALITSIPIILFTEHIYDDSGRYYCAETGWLLNEVEHLELPYGIALLLLQYFLPVLVCIITFVKIGLLLSKLQERDGQDALNKAKRNTARMSLIIVVAYTLSWLPLNVMILFGPVIFAGEYAHLLFFTCHFLAMAHACFNPIIYAGTSSSFRLAICSLFSRKRSRQLNDTIQTSFDFEPIGLVGIGTEAETYVFDQTLPTSLKNNVI